MLAIILIIISAWRQEWFSNIAIIKGIIFWLVLSINAIIGPVLLKR